MTNADLEKIVDTSDEWIRTRTGIERRHVVEPGTPTSAICVPAALDALERRGMAASELDLIIVGTVTPDMVFPATACLVQDKIKATRAWGFDISAACSGFVYALTVGAQFVEAGTHSKVMVIGADVMTSILDYRERTTCVLFGDGAGAVILEPTDDETGILDYLNEVDGSGARYLHMPAGGSAMPPSHETVEKRMHVVRQEGPHAAGDSRRGSGPLGARLRAHNGCLRTRGDRRRRAGRPCVRLEPRADRDPRDSARCHRRPAPNEQLPHHCVRSDVALSLACAAAAPVASRHAPPSRREASGADPNRGGHLGMALLLSGALLAARLTPQPAGIRGSSALAATSTAPRSVRAEVISAELETTKYRLTISTNAGPVELARFALAPGRSWRGTVRRPRGTDAAELLLYRGAERLPYRRVVVPQAPT